MKPMKPRLIYRDGWWRCGGSKPGRTPLAAYQAWFARSRGDVPRDEAIQYQYADARAYAVRMGLPLVFSL